MSLKARLPPVTRSPWVRGSSMTGGGEVAYVLHWAAPLVKPSWKALTRSKPLPWAPSTLEVTPTASLKLTIPAMARLSTSSSTVMGPPSVAR